MGHSKAEKIATHEKIVRIAAERFRQHGIDGISVADLMKEAGVTVGGFYKHFESRDQLVIEAVTAALADYNLFDGSTKSLSKAITKYLSEEHRDSPNAGCAMGALLGEIGRASPGVRRLYTEQFENSLNTVGPLLAKKHSHHSRADSLLFLCTLLGAINLARAVDDPTLSREILRTVAKQLISQTGH